MRRSIRRPALRSLPVGLGVVSALASPTSAQVVRGTAVEAATGAPIEGGFVTLVDRAGDAATATLTGPDGTFLLRVFVADTYRLRVERIGYESWTSESFEAGPGRTVTRQLRIPVRPVSLEELTVAVESVCRARPGAGPALARVWEEARKALEMATWTERSAGVVFELRRWERVLDPETRRVRKERTFAAEKRAWRTFVSAPATELSAEGYVRRTEEGAWRFFAPDAEVLLSDTFADDHCFSVVEGEGDEAGLVGLAFEPVPGRETPDVEGVLWLDGTTSELRHLEFTYSNPGLERPLDRYPASGWVEFARLPTGHWFVRRWHLRMPVAGERTGVRLGPDRTLRPGRERLLAAVREVGGEAVRATLADGETVPLAAWGAVEGTVHAGAGGGPIPGVEVELAGTAYRARTDLEGRFRIAPVPPGAYTLTIRRPEAELLALLGLPGNERSVTVRPERTERVSLRIASPAAVLDEVCGPPPDEEGAPGGVEPGASGVARAAIFGRVYAKGSGEPAIGARVWIADRAWAAPGPDPPRPTVAGQAPSEWTGVAVEADSAGVYLACAIPGDAALVAQAGTATAASDTSTIRIDAGELARLDFELADGARPLARFEAGAEAVDLDTVVDEILAGRRDEADRGLATLVGTVTSAEDGRPVAGARVRLVGRDEERVTGADGTFVIADLPRGRYRVVTEHLGMGSDTAEVDLRTAPGQAARFTLDTRPIPLPTLDVEIERTFRNARLAGFYARMHRGLGDFVTREDLEARDVVANMRRIPAVRVDQCLRGSLRVPNCWNLEIARGYSIGAGGLGTCPPLIYLDGHLIPESSGDDNAFTRVQHLPREMLEGLEVYRNPAGAPAQYRAIGDACGIVLVWTRGR